MLPCTTLICCYNRGVYCAVRVGSLNKSDYGWTQFWLVRRFRKIATISSVLSVCPSIHPHGTTQLQMDGFSWKFIFEYFSKICREIRVLLKSDKNNGYFTWKQTYIFDHISLISSRTRNVSHKNPRQNQNTDFFFRKSYRLWDNLQNLVQPDLPEMTT
jgi:hypothetical protein